MICELHKEPQKQMRYDKIRNKVPFRWKCLVTIETESVFYSHCILNSFLNNHCLSLRDTLLIENDSGKVLFIFTLDSAASQCHYTTALHCVHLVLLNA